MIVWPGGTLAEQRDDLYGLNFDDLYTPAQNRPGLSDMMATAVKQGAGLSIVLPTQRYLGDLPAMREDLDGFLDDLLGGAFGKLPQPMVLEIGNEYFANFTGTNKAAAYGAIADEMVTEIALALADRGVNTTGADITISVQTGKTAAEDAQIRGEMSDFALSNVDMIVHHRFAFQPQGIDPKIPQLEAAVDAWEKDVTEAGGDAPDLFVSAWNTVTLTRNGVLNDYIASQGNGIDKSAIDLDGRTHTGFERFWQNKLATAAYGQEHAAYILESYASYAEAGMDAGAVYGVESPHPGALSWREDGKDYHFVGSEMLQMLYESVEDTHVLESARPYNPNDPVTLYGFENEDKLVVFLAAGDRAPGDIVVDVDGLGTGLRSVHAERLTSETPADWMAIFDIPDNPNVNETPEAEAYALGVREALKPQVTGDGIVLSLEDPHDIIRLAFAKTARGEREIAKWSDAKAVDLDPLPIAQVDDTATAPDPIDSDTEISEAVSETAGMGGGGIGAIMLLVLLLL
ncbi:MAG: hypothetical protein AAFQ79_04635 [Pseudomonadota bacterium]